jgi:acyl carrier protein
MALPEKLKAEVIAIVADIAELELDEIQPDSKLEDLGVDSLGGLRVVAAVEKRFGLVIPEEEIGKIRTMPDIFELVVRHADEVK